MYNLSFLARFQLSRFEHVLYQWKPLSHAMFLLMFNLFCLTPSLPQPVKYPCFMKSAYTYLSANSICSGPSITNLVSMLTNDVCSLTKGITPTICRLCICILMNKRSFELFMCLGIIRAKKKRNKDLKSRTSIGHFQVTSCQ